MALNAPEFNARLLRRGLLDNGYSELPIVRERAVATDSLPLINKAPFDRILVAQAMAEGITLLTSDPRVAQYPGPLRLVCKDGGRRAPPMYLCLLQASV